MLPCLPDQVVHWTWDLLPKYTATMRHYYPTFPNGSCVCQWPFRGQTGPSLQPRDHNTLPSGTLLGLPVALPQPPFPLVPRFPLPPLPHALPQGLSPLTLLSSGGVCHACPCLALPHCQGPSQPFPQPPEPHYIACFNLLLAFRLELNCQAP